MLFRLLSIFYKTHFISSYLDVMHFYRLKSMNLTHHLLGQRAQCCNHIQSGCG